MDTDNEFEFGGVPLTPLGVPSPDDEDSAFGPSSDAPVRAPKRLRQRRPLALSSVAALCTFLVCDTRLKSSYALEHAWAHSRDSEPHYDGELLAIVGVIMYSYVMRSAKTECGSDDLHQLEGVARRKHRGANGGFRGLIEYSAQHIYALEQPFDLFLEELTDPFAPIGWCRDLAFIDVSGFTLEQLCTKHLVAKPACFFFLRSLIVTANYLSRS